MADIGDYSDGLSPIGGLEGEDRWDGRGAIGGTILCWGGSAGFSKQNVVGSGELTGPPGSTGPAGLVPLTIKRIL